MHFQTQMEKALPTLCQLLGSKSISDVNESIEFFVVASEFGLQSAIVGVRRMLVLIWSRDSAVRDAVVEAYKGLYLDPEAPNARYMHEHCIVLKGIREMKGVKLWAYIHCRFCFHTLFLSSLQYVFFFCNTFQV